MSYDSVGFLLISDSATYFSYIGVYVDQILDGVSAENNILELIGDPGYYPPKSTGSVVVSGPKQRWITGL